MDRRAFVATLAAAAGLPALARIVPAKPEWQTFHLGPELELGGPVYFDDPFRMPLIRGPLVTNGVGTITAIEDGTITVEFPTFANG
jgi:hypothetical protein